MSFFIRRSVFRFIYHSLFISYLILSSSDSLKAQDATIIDSDVSGCTVEYIPNYLAQETLFVDGTETVRLVFSGAIGSSQQKYGEPEIRFRSILIDLPGMEKNSVSVLQSEYEEIRNVNIPPVPFPEINSNGLVSNYRLTQSYYTQSGLLPKDIVWLEHIGETRGTFIGSLRISPIQFDPAKKILLKYTRLKIRINYGNIGELHRNIGIKDDFGKNDIINFRKGKMSPGFPVSAKRNSVLSSGTWFRFNVQENGIYKLTGRTMISAGIPSGTNPGTIRLYSNGGFELPIDISSTYPDDLTQIAIEIFDGDSVGRLDPDDYIVFYGKSSRGWKYTPSSKSFSHYINRFDDDSYYWLTYSGVAAKQAPVVPSTHLPTGVHNLQSVEAKLFREDDKSNVFDSGIEWLGESFQPGGQILYRHQLAGIDLTLPIRYKFKLGSLADQYSTFEIFEHDSLISSLSLYGGPAEYPNLYSNQVSVPGAIPNFSEDQSVLRFRYNTSSSSGRGYIDWYEIFYRRQLKAQSDYFSFNTPDTNTIVNCRISGFSGGAVRVYDVTRFDSLIVIGDIFVSMDTADFQLNLNAGSTREIYAVGQNGFKSPGPLSTVKNQNIHGDDNEAEFVIITHKDFLSAADKLKRYRENKMSNPISTHVFDLDEIYNEFGCGSSSPMAVRNFLKYAYLNWQKPPKYLLLFGDGDYDYKRITGIIEPNRVPPWESQESFYQLNSYASDDLYGIFFSGDRVNIGIGRLPVSTSSEAEDVVNKIISYETESVADLWKLRFTFVADDGPAAPGRNDDSIHMVHADGIAAMVPRLFEQKKIYAYEYPTLYTPAGRRKPTANEAIRNSINQGSIILNFAGHGNPRLWTHEAIFVRETDFPLLNNNGRYFFLVAATCNYAVFDLPNEKSSGELLMLMKNAGAIGVFSALRPVYADDNYALNANLYRAMIDTTRFGTIRSQRLGDIVYRTKQQITDLTNDRKYFLIGDPAMELAFPKFVASVDSINHTVNTQPIQLPALSRANIDASIRDTSLNLLQQFSGKCKLAVYDADKSNIIYAPELGSGYKYTTSGSIIFKGQDTIVNGKMNGEFIIPKDISYSNAQGRAVIYFTGDSVDGAGFTRNIILNGTDTTAIADDRGPQISLFIDRRNFRAGDVVNSSPVLIADLIDSSGINTSGGGVGHRLEAWLDNNSESIDLSEYYSSKVNTYRIGTVEYPLGPLSNGTHTLRLRAWDTYNNPSTSETMFNVVSGTGLTLSHIFNYPNPISNVTYFTFEHNQVNPIDAEVKIYTVAGRLIQAINKKGILDKFVKIYWDGFDKDGDRLANGVYLYKIIAKTPDGRFNTEAVGKMSVLR
ncbi:MAG: type IX secretion system sortase PorU [Ignavibacteriales bacterium]|nr:type IX secretion system sortase PorU [Ignavibacteriales bacterium]